MRAIRCIAVNVFRETVRERVLYVLVLFAVLLIVSSYLLGQLTAGQDVKIIKDLGLAATSLFGLSIAVFIGVGLVSKEIERRSVYALLSKPISRPQFIVGKYAGLVLTLAITVAVMAAALYLVLWRQASVASPLLRASWEAPAVDPALLKAVFLILVELMLVTAVALFFSTFSGTYLSATFTIALYVAGHFSQDLRDFEGVVDSRPAAWLARGLSHVLPDLAAFDVKAQVVHGFHLSTGYLATTAAYGGAYIAALLLGAMLVFSRRDLK